MAKIVIDDCIDIAIESLDFDHLLVFADALSVEIEYPPVDDMYPDWENEIRVETGDELRKAIDFEYPEEARQLQTKNKRLKEIAVKAILDEPECPGDMPDEMWETIKNDRDAATRTYQIVVKQTKENIIGRFEQALRKTK